MPLLSLSKSSFFYLSFYLFPLLPTYICPANNPEETHSIRGARRLQRQIRPSPALSISSLSHRQKVNEAPKSKKLTGNKSIGLSYLRAPFAADTLKRY
jgi:hypothetical protein